MITIHRADERGHANHGWLDSYHTFSFGGYYNPDMIGFSVLRVMNEDRVQPDNGFGTHPHKNMEIISYVVSGELEHKDSMGNGSVIKPGEFQIITAGSGITHSECNPSKSETTHFYQMWIVPDTEGLTPAYGQRAFDGDSALELVGSKSGEARSLRVNQDIKLYRGKLAAGQSLTLPVTKERKGWLQIVRGDLILESEKITKSDGVAFTESEGVELQSETDTEFLFFDLP